MKRSCLAVLLLAAASGARAQDAPPTFSAEAELVVVDVVATDAQGRPVRGLTRDDFAVYEDGRPQALLLFEPVDRPAQPAPAAAPPALEPEARDSAAEGALLVVAFDEPHLGTVATEQVRRTLDQAWRKEGAARTEVLLVSTLSEGSWQGRLPEDRDELIAALERYRGRKTPSGSRMTDYEAFLIAARSNDAMLTEVYRRYLDQGLLPDPTMVLPAAPKAMRGRPQTEAQAGLPPMFRAMVSAEAQQRWSSARKQQAATLKSLTRLLQGLAGRREKKAVLLVSEGFVLDPAVLEHRELVEAARHARAALHVVDPRGNDVLFAHDAVESRDPLDSRDSLQTQARLAKNAEGAEALAHATGGRVLRSLPDLGTALTRIGDELRTYYLLGYAPAAGHGPDGRYRKLKVEARQPDLRLQARPGYYAAAPAALRAARQRPAEALTAALDSPFLATGLPVHLAAYVLGPGRKGGSMVRLVAEVDGAALPGATLDAAFQLSGRETPGVMQSVQSATVSREAPQRVRLEAQMEAPPGAYQARLVVREREGAHRLGSARRSLEVLPAEAFRLTTPILTSVLQQQKLVAPAERRFARDGLLHCAVEVLGASAEGPVTAGLAIQAADGRVPLRVPPTALTTAPRSRQWSIPLASLEPGLYEVVISVQDASRGQGLQTRERFEVVAGRPLTD